MIRRPIFSVSMARTAAAAAPKPMNARMGFGSCVNARTAPLTLSVTNSRKSRSPASAIAMPRPSRALLNSSIAPLNPSSLASATSAARPTSLPILSANFSRDGAESSMMPAAAMARAPNSLILSCVVAEGFAMSLKILSSGRRLLPPSSPTSNSETPMRLRIGESLAESV